MPPPWNCKNCEETKFFVSDVMRFSLLFKKDTFGHSQITGCDIHLVNVREHLFKNNKQY